MGLENSVCCRQCGSTETKATLTPHLSHHARIDCMGCGSFVGWQAKPRDERQAPKPRRTKGLIERINPGFCVLCRRRERDLPGAVVMQAHHIVAVEEGGTDELGNLLPLCSDCHKQVHATQKVFKHYEAGA